MKFDLTLHLSDIILFLSIVTSALIFALTYWITKRRDRELMNRGIYQRLELASIDVFKSEIEHPELGLIWQEESNPSTDSPFLGGRLDNYIYQQLNLFEMAYAFRRQNLMRREVFGSWVIWFAKLCESKYFQEFWMGKDAEAPLNYIPGLRKVMTQGCLIYANDQLAPEEKREAFFKFVGEHINCPLVTEWLEKN